MSEGGYGQDVRDEMPRQETHQDETGGDSCAQRTDYALTSQYWGELPVYFIS